MNPQQTVGIIGAGKLSMVLAKHLLRAGYRVLVSSTRAPQDFALILDVMVPGAEGTFTEELIERADIVVLALPLSAIKTLPADKLAGKLVIDAANHWLEVDGHFPELGAFPGTSSQYVASLLPGSRVVKAFNHLGYHDLDQMARPAGSNDRIGMAIAGQSDQDVAQVAELVDAVGFTPVLLEELADTRVLEGGSPGFGLAVSPEELRAVIAQEYVRS